MDVPGIFARSIDDVKIAFEVMLGHDDKVGCFFFSFLRLFLKFKHNKI